MIRDLTSRDVAIFSVGVAVGCVSLVLFLDMVFAMPKWDPPSPTLEQAMLEKRIKESDVMADLRAIEVALEVRREAQTKALAAEARAKALRIDPTTLDPSYLIPH